MLTKGSSYRVILTPTNFPFAGEARTRNTVDVFLTSGFIDFRGIVSTQSMFRRPGR